MILPETREDVLEKALAIIPDPAECLALVTKSLETLRDWPQDKFADEVLRAERLVEDLNKLVDK